jgi:L-2,4-diaminobutyric acid acetyltransferase
VIPIIRKPALEDAGPIERLIRSSPPLDANSAYAYLMLCRHFGETCAVAEHDDNVVGFVSAYRPPSDPQTLFVWQVVIDGSMRGQGLAGTLIDDILGRDACDGVTQVETTIGPDNAASLKLFESLARKRGAAINKVGVFTADLLGGGDHDDEVLYRIGPIERQGLQIE